MRIELQQCPEALRKRVEEKMSKMPSKLECEILSVECREGTPYLDKSIIIHIFEVIILCGNMFTIFTQIIGEALIEEQVSEDSLIFATVINILENAPEWTGLQKR